MSNSTLTVRPQFSKQTRVSNNCFGNRRRVDLDEEEELDLDEEVIVDLDEEVM